MRWVRGIPLPTILAIIASFLIGLSSNRVYNDSSSALEGKGGGGGVELIKGEREMLSDERMEEILETFG